MELKTNNPQSLALSSQFTNELLNPTFDLAIDYSEIYLDDLIDNPTLREIPIVKSVVGIIKSGISINQFFFAKKLLTFISEFNSGDINSAKILEFKNKLENDSKFRKKATEQIMVYLDRFNEINKAKISANLLKAYVEGEITYDKFISINLSLDRLHPDSYSLLSKLEKINYEFKHDYKEDRDFEAEALLLVTGLAHEPSDWWSGLKLNGDGRLLFELGIKPAIKYKE